MDDLTKETITLVPHAVFAKAKELYNRQLYEVAFEILVDNAVKFDIYEAINKIEVSIARPVGRTYANNSKYLPKPMGRVKGKRL